MERERSETSVEVDSNPGQATQLAVGDFVTDSVHVTLSLTEEGISWRNLVDTSEVTLPWFDVITCHRGQVSPKTPTKIIGDLDNNKGFTLHYIDKQANRVWRHKHKTFLSNGTNFEDILSAVQEKSKKDRPSRLLVLINPVGGPSGQGEAQYRRVVAPLFRLAKIDTEVIVSQSPSHPEELGNTFDFSRVTGVVVAGGDGTLQKLLHTLLPRIQKDAGIQIGTTDADLKALPFPVGMIPTGTQNGIAKELCGSDDIETAALNIITGCRTFKNIASISQGNEHLGFTGVIFGHGFWSEIMEYIEDRRLGRLRFLLAMIAIFWRSRSEFNIRIDYLPYEPQTGGSDVDNSTVETEPVWKTIEGRYTGLMCFPTLVRPQKNTPKGVFDVNAEAMTLLMEKQCGRLTFISYMNKLTELHRDTFSYDFVTTLQVKSFRLRVIPTEGSTDRVTRLERAVSLDGEVYKVEAGDLDVTVRLHRNLLEMFGAGNIAEE